MNLYSNHELRINDFAKRSFRDIADLDYIAARQASRAGLVPQFLWSSLQAFEKYLKYILLVNRIPARKVGHNIKAGLELVISRVDYISDLQLEKYSVFEQVALYGEDRYLIGSYSAHGRLLPQLDAAVWDLRRYCQVLKPPVGSGHTEQRMFELMLEAIVSSRSNPTKFKLQGGILEEIVASKSHPSNAALCWQNAFFGKRARARIKARNYMHGANAPLWLYPEMIDDLDDLIYIPKSMAEGYRAHRDDILSGKIERP